MDSPDKFIRPAALKPGDKVALLSPATIVKREYVEGAARWIEQCGWQPVVMPHANGAASGTYASAEADRTADFEAAWLDPDIKAIICARGGYGCVHLISRIPESVLRQNAKWLVGFSDVSALHAMLSHAGIESIHGPMAKHLTLFPDDECSLQLRSILEGQTPDAILADTVEGCIPGHARGQLRGGNLAVIDGLAATPFDMFDLSTEEPVILFIEDIAEPIYKVERILWRLHLSGALSRAAGLLCGQFTEYRPDANFPSMEHMIAARLRQFGWRGKPLALNMPVGHTDHNRPVVVSRGCSLTVDTHLQTLSLSI